MLRLAAVLIWLAAAAATATNASDSPDVVRTSCKISELMRCFRECPRFQGSCYVKCLQEHTCDLDEDGMTAIQRLDTARRRSEADNIQRDDAESESLSPGASSAPFVRRTSEPRCQHTSLVECCIEEGFDFVGDRLVINQTRWDTCFAEHHCAREADSQVTPTVRDDGNIRQISASGPKAQSTSVQPSTTQSPGLFDLETGQTENAAKDTKAGEKCKLQAILDCMDKCEGTKPAKKCEKECRTKICRQCPKLCKNRAGSTNVALTAAGTLHETIRVLEDTE